MKIEQISNHEVAIIPEAVEERYVASNLQWDMMYMTSKYWTSTWEENGKLLYVFGREGITLEGFRRDLMKLIKKTWFRNGVDENEKSI